MSKTKWKITIQNICLIDIPTRQNRIFLKIKNCLSNAITKSYQIINNKCEFTDPVDVEVNLPSNLLEATNKNSKNLKVKPLRLSFRLESSSRSGFQRYGIVEVDLLKLAFDVSGQTSTTTFNFRSGLENCTEKPIFIANFVFPQGFIPKDIIFQPSPQLDQDIKDISIDSISSKIPNNSSSQYSSPICSQSSQKSRSKIVNSKSEKAPSISNSNSYSNSKHFRSCPIKDEFVIPEPIPPLSISATNSLSTTGNSNPSIKKSQTTQVLSKIQITKQRYDELESEIDNLLADIINDETIQ